MSLSFISTLSTSPLFRITCDKRHQFFGQRCPIPSGGPFLAVDSLSRKHVRCCVEQPAWKKGPVDVDFAKDEQLQLLEEELEKVVEAENFERASEIRDKLLRLQSSAYVSVLSVNMAYYKALNKASIVDMAGCWLQDSSVTCTHPDIGLVKGYINVLNSYGYTFYKGASYVDVKNIQIVMRGTVGYVTCEEHVMTWNADGSKASNVVTSVIQIYSKKNGHWYICHHSSTPSGVTKK